VRWWALNSTLQSCLEQDGDASAATQTLHQINQLYTVYDNIMLFDRNCRVVATSNPKRRAMVGKTLSQPWAREALALRDSQSYCISQFEPLAAYDNQHCYVFAATVRGSDHRAVGALAVVFDCAAQLSGMLHDVLPLTADGNISDGYTGLLLDSAGKVIASTHDHKPGDTISLSPQLLSPPPEGAVDVMIVNGHYHAVGARRCHGYREFSGIGAIAVVMRSLGEQQTGKHHRATALTFTHRSKQGNDTLDLAVVSCGEHWLAIPSKSVVEAIDDTAITRVPGRAAWFSGVTRYQGNMLPVVDLAQWINTGTTNLRTSRAVVVVQEGDDLIGLAIDQLGDVLTVAKDEIVTMDTLGTNARTKLTPQVVRPRSADDSALLLLDIQALAALLNPERYARSA
jgi:chemotaxis signal transduction protein